MKAPGFFGGCLALFASFFIAKAGMLRPGQFFWEPELSPSGPLVIIISLPDQALSAYRNGIRIAYSSISSGTKGRSTPAGVFTILEKRRLQTTRSV
jgi:L,D-transpeptidase catalytic domain